MATDRPEKTPPIQGPPSGVKGSPVPARPAPKSKPTTKPAAAPAGASGAVYAAIVKAAKETGVPLALALAMAQQESGFNTRSAGDHGFYDGNGHFHPDPNGPATSFGLYNLHKGGELGKLTSEQAYDPYTNAKVALTQVAAVMKQHPNYTLGQIAAAAQRPADPVGYASSVNGILGHAQSDPQYFATRIAKAGGGSAPAVNVSGTLNVTDGGLPPNATPTQVKASVASKFGYLSAFLDDPEIGPILMQAAQQGWDMPTLEGALYKTKFWQQHSATTRQWDAQTQLDPATSRAAVAQQTSDLAAQARKTGLNFQSGRLAQIALDSLRFGWNAQQTTNALLAEGKLDLSGKQPNEALTDAASLRQQAAQYLVPLSDASVQKWVQQIVSGQVSTNNFDAYLKEQAKSLFPSLAHAIDSGTTVAQYADPYKQIAAQTLEVDPESINFTDPKWNKALFQVDPKTGARTAMSLNDWQHTLKTDPTYGWSKTNQANSQVADFATSLLNTFGKVAN